ncbi:hypothetical protein ACRE_008840 [Hapsidospora chrysogenum ATCC 11550]|uniref:UDENN FLCN/SMCR8-type domain-containing protein n=1 Tax=Hapsidospora chrysogenum (strain ATCC 11550 / CBS 779.69 / DSM 880 / IAM 14645 / JCM 23072 / IMI 49137) TaxID=857340 RepID=A0A086TFX6_HAPC1|nr:hypothetical protein ACRE_008840 [Hapsidospora chrysogenum ATCC 11550]
MGKALELITSLQLALAHYCDIHGPTPLMVTEGLPVPCTTCYDDLSASADAIPRSSGTGAAPQDVSDALRDLSISRNASTPTAETCSQLKRASTRPLATSNPTTPGPDTPPGSPRPPNPSQARADSSFRRTYDDTVTKKQGPCDNCAMTLPRKSATTSGNIDASDNKGPTLRTRAPAERVFGTGGQASPPSSRTSSDTDGEREMPRQPRNRRMVPASSSRTTSCSSTSTTTSDNAPFHVHYVDYTSTHEPVLPNSFSLLRASCLRTLSFETLPRAPATNPPAAPTASPHSSANSFVTTQSAGSSVSGGPIFFGDALAGYTTAYIFRIPDVHARGHKRVYAFIALSTHKERLAMKTFAVVSAAFRELATWIQQLAETEAERSADSSPVGSAFYGGGGYHQPQQPPSASSSVVADRGGSSFLAGASGFTRRMAGGGGGLAPKARGLAELVGQPDFFIELHRKFVQLLFEVGVTLNS